MITLVPATVNTAFVAPPAVDCKKKKLYGKMPCLMPPLEGATCEKMCTLPDARNSNVIYFMDITEIILKNYSLCHCLNYSKLLLSFCFVNTFLIHSTLTRYSLVKEWY